MTSRLQQRRARLKAEYGFDFPDDFHRFWEFASKLSPLAPLEALSDALSASLVGPFEVLSGRFDGRVPKHSLLLHWRYYGDPPEFFTVLAGGGDGLHFGYYFDAPDDASASRCVCHYWASDAYEFSSDGDTLFDSVRMHLEHHQADLDCDLDYDSIDQDEYDDGVKELDRVRRRLVAYATGDRSETGQEYTELYGESARDDLIVAQTSEHMGIVTRPELYRPLSLRGKKLWQRLRSKKANLSALAEEARQALREGFPGAALELGKGLWATGDPRKAELSYELLDAAYAALGRETLRRVLHTHRANRDLPSVDILDGEE